MSAPIRPRSIAPKSRRPSAEPKRRGPSSQKDAADGSKVRLQKLLASAGIGSRRKCEELIAAGRVTVDGRTVTELGTKVDPDAADVRVDTESLPRSHLVYYMVNKPLGVVSTTRDPDGRPRVIDLAPDGQRLFTVGRLDVSSEGLIVVTNDGELANLLAHPRYGVEKTYQVQVAGVPEPEVLQRLRRGVHLAEGFAHAKRVWVKSQHKQSTILEMVLDEGKNREVRRLLAQVGHKVLHLRRTALGPLRLGELPPGECRPLRRDEVRELREAAVAGARSEGRGAREEETSEPQGASRGLKGQVPAVREQEPKKRQGAVAEATRGKSGTVIGNVPAANGGRAKVGGPRQPGRPAGKAAVGRRKQFQLRREKRR